VNRQLRLVLIILLAALVLGWLAYRGGFLVGSA
jgi:hypothetical protein